MAQPEFWDGDGDETIGKIGIIPVHTHDGGFQYNVSTWTPDAFVAAGYGSTEFVQIAHPGRYRTIYNPNDTSQTWAQTYAANLGPMLDSLYPLVNKPADGTLNTDFDGPVHSLDALNFECQYLANESYETRLMYLPPGSLSQYVPIDEADWSYHCSCTRAPGGVWTPDLGSSTVAQNMVPDFPIWTMFTGNYHGYVTSPPW